MAESRLFPMGDHAVLRNIVVAMVTLAVGFGMVAGAPAPGSSAAIELGASGEDGAYCVRPLVDVIWGFLLTLFALFISVWGSSKYFSNLKNKFAKALLSVLCGVCLPLLDLQFNIQGSSRCFVMLWKYHEQDNQGSSSMQLIKKVFSSSLCPCSKSPLRILATCDIVLYVRKDSQLYERHREYLQDVETNPGVDELEAIIIGDQTMAADYHKINLSDKLIFALVLAEVLPDYNQLKFLRGNSGFATIAIAFQAFGYIYAVSFRSFIGKQVAPVEVLGLILNLIILIKTILYSTCNPCYRPLVIYMNREQEGKLLKTLDDYVREPSDEIQIPYYNKYSSSIVCAIVAFLSILLIIFIVIVMRRTNIGVRGPLILFTITIVLSSLCAFFLPSDPTDFTIFVVLPVLNLVVYIWALVLTFTHWKSDHFDAQGLLRLLDYSQLLPFIG